MLAQYVPTLLVRGGGHLVLTFSPASPCRRLWHLPRSPLLRLRLDGRNDRIVIDPIGRVEAVQELAQPAAMPEGLAPEHYRHVHIIAAVSRAVRGGENFTLAGFQDYLASLLV